MKQTDIYKKLKQLRKERGLTLATLADKIGSDYQQISRIERGKSRLTVDVLMKMADAFDTSIDELIKPVSEKALPASSSSHTHPPTNPPTNPKIYEDKLSEILEKIEAALKETQGSLSPQAKALLTSLLYKEALSNPRAIDFAIGIVKAILSSK